MINVRLIELVILVCRNVLELVRMMLFLFMVGDLIGVSVGLLVVKFWLFVVRLFLNMLMNLRLVFEIGKIIFLVLVW